MKTLRHSELLARPELFNRMEMVAKRATALIEETHAHNCRIQDIANELDELEMQAAAIIDTLSIMNKDLK